MLRGSRSRRGSVTVGDALVVLGILGILSGVTSKRPRAAPEEVCLGNVKKICAAIRMYLSDNDGRLPPREHRRDVVAYFRDEPGRGGPGEKKKIYDWLTNYRCEKAWEANPYLRWPVVLDSYVESRAVWRCPSARLEQPAAFIIGAEDWLSNLQENEAVWGSGAEQLCLAAAYPPGWGGEVTDSLAQGRLAVRGLSRDGPGIWSRSPGRADAPPGVFVQSVGVNASVAGERAAALPDPKWFVICADGGAMVHEFATGTLAYPDICALECGNEECGWVDWEECTEAADCGLYNHAPMDGSFLVNWKLRQARARHKGGVNIGFLDGHARWLHSERVIALSPSQGDPERGRLRGYGPWGPTSDYCFAEENPGVPTLY